MGFSMSTLKSSKELNSTGCYMDHKYLEDPSKQVVFLIMDFVNNQ